MQRSIYLLLPLAILLLHCQRREAVLHADLASFHIQEGFQIELAAAEPVVRDVVAMEIDENGTVYVVEMPGYPLDVSGSGRIKILEDEDGDGFFEKGILFADSLVLPTGIMRWKSGVIVTDAPDVLYLEDTDGDGHADHREVLLTGFSRSNPQHNMNTPKYGLDNWIYLGHEGAFITKTFEDEFGDTGAAIRFPNQADGPELPKNAGNRCVRFRPDRQQLEMLSGRTQFGYDFDTWGNIFYTSNADHLFHEVIAARYLEGKPHLPLRTSRNYLPEYGPGAEIYPITLQPEHQILTDVGTITSASGLTIYRDLSFVAEPVHNLVHTDRLVPAGASFVAKRQYKHSEFLASEDSWFRPVNFYAGPQGALYLLDYHRQHIEHPEWMAAEVVASGQLYNGRDKGRIYRITTTADTGSKTARTQPRLGARPTNDLIPLLAHPNRWWRIHAQRLLTDKAGLETIAALTAFGHQTSSEIGLLHTLWTLRGLEQFDPELLRKALLAQEPGLRVNAIKIAEMHLAEASELLPELLKLHDDPDAKVRFQLLCTLSLQLDPAHEEIRRSILLQDPDDKWFQIMALAGATGREATLLEWAIAHLQEESSPGMLDFIGRISQTIGQSRQQAGIKKTIRMALQLNTEQAEKWQGALLTGLAAGLTSAHRTRAVFEQERRQLLTRFGREKNHPLRAAILDLLETLDLPAAAAPQARNMALQVLHDQDTPPREKVDAIRLLSLAGLEQNIDLIRQLVAAGQSIDVQKAALRALNTVDPPAFGLGGFLFADWHAFTPAVQREGISLCLTRPSSTNDLLNAVESGVLQPSQISWRHTFRLLNHRVDSLKSKARNLLAGEEEAREAVVASYQPALEGRGDVARGKAVFATACSSCHQVGGAGGIHFGPDLASIRNRSKSAIMKDILLPNRAIADGYAMWEILLNDETSHYGIIADEVGNRIMLRDATGAETSIDRGAIASMNVIPSSAMTAGLEKQVPIPDMRDLLVFLKQPFSAGAQTRPPGKAN